MKHLLTLFIAIISSVSLFAQNSDTVPFNGLVVNTFDKGIKAQIFIKNTSLMTSSTKDGRFGFTSINANDTLVVKYKKAEIEVPVGGRKSIKIRIMEDYKADATFEPELVDMGYNFVNRREMTTTSHGITGDLFTRGIYHSLAEAIQNFVPGASVSEDGQVMLRGINSLLGSSYALIIVDGIEMQALTDVNIYDIDNVEVSSDGSMYGVRGSNGVIIIKTKRQ